MKDYPIQITPKPFKLSPHDTEKLKDNPSCLMVAAVFTSRDKKVRHRVQRAFKSIYNLEDTSHAAEQPQGSHFVFVGWSGDKESPPTDVLQKAKILCAVRTQRKWNRKAVPITIQGVIPTAFDYPLKLGEQEITLRQILASLRTRTDWTESLFNSIDTDWAGITYGICHKDYKNEATQIVQNLLPLLRARFDKKVDSWFEGETIELCKGVSYDSNSKQIVLEVERSSDVVDPEVLALKNLSLSKYKILKKSGMTDKQILEISDDDSSIDPEDYEYLEDEQIDQMGKEEVEIEFDLQHMFNSAPALNTGAHKLCASVSGSMTTFPSFGAGASTRTGASGRSYSSNASYKAKKQPTAAKEALKRQTEVNKDNV